MTEAEKTPQRPIPYNTTDPLAMKWTELALELLNSGKLTAAIITTDGITAARINGACPYCDDQIHVTEPLTAITEGSEAVLGRATGGDGAAMILAERYEDVTVTCGCNEMHAGNPEKSSGCGTSFRISMSIN